MNLVTLAAIIIIRVTIPAHSHSSLVFNEFSFVEDVCNYCNTSLNYDYYKPHCNHLLCFSCFFAHDKKEKCCPICGVSFLEPDMRLPSDLFPDN